MCCWIGFWLFLVSLKSFAIKVYLNRTFFCARLTPQSKRQNTLSQSSLKFNSRLQNINQPQFHLPPHNHVLYLPKCSSKLRAISALVTIPPNLLPHTAESSKEMGFINSQSVNNRGSNQSIDPAGDCGPCGKLKGTAMNTTGLFGGLALKISC